MKVADRDGEGVRGVGGFGWFGKFEETRNHQLDLLLFGAAVTHYSGLDGQRRVLGDLEASGSGGEHGYSANLAEFES
jgi:hypothetical protein